VTDRLVRKTLPGGGVLVASFWGALGPAELAPYGTWAIWLEGDEEHKAVGSPLAWTISQLVDLRDGPPGWAAALAAEIETEFRSN
jgi:hypothetical protein